jgi:hypothetical protein
MQDKEGLQIGLTKGQGVSLLSSAQSMSSVESSSVKS